MWEHCQDILCGASINCSNGDNTGSSNVCELSYRSGGGFKSYIIRN